MFVWLVLLAGPLVLPLAMAVRTDVPPILSDTLLLVGVLTLFLAICATEVVGTSAGRETKPTS